MTKKRIETWRKDLVEWNEDPSNEYIADVNALCDLALQSLSQESVRSEARNAALEEAAKVCDKHCEFLKDEIKRGGEFEYLNARYDEAKWLAEKFRAKINAPEVALQSPTRVAEGEEHIYTKADMEAACALVLAGFRSKPMLDKMVDRFLAWPLPFSVCADLVATRQEHGRIGTNLLTAAEAREMLDYVLQADIHSTELRK